MKALYLLVALLFIAACATQVEIQDDTEPAPDSEVKPMEPEPMDEPEPEPEPVAEATGVAKTLQDRAKKVTSYSFLRADLTKEVAQNFYFVRDDKMRIDPRIPAIVEKGHVDHVFLDMVTKEATGRCYDPVLCDKELNAEYLVSYSDWIVELPEMFLEEVPNDAVIKGGRAFEDQQTDIVHYKKGGFYYLMLAHKYYGMPMHVSWYSDEARTKMVGGFDFRDFAFNTIKEEDVEAWQVDPSGKRSN